MRILMTTSIPLYPKTNGKRVMMSGIWEFLNECPDIKAVKLVSFSSQSLPHDPPANKIWPPRAVSKVVNTVWSSFLMHRRSIQESFCWSSRSQRDFDAIIRDFKPNVIFYDTLRIGQYCNRKLHPDVRHIIYLEDLFSLRYERMLQSIEESSVRGMNAIGNFGDRIPRPLLMLYHYFPSLQSWLLRLEMKLMKTSETKAPNQFDECLLISSGECKILADMANATNIEMIPPRMNGPLPSKRQWNGRPDFIFLGALNLPHNRVGIESFLDKHLDRLIEAISNFHITIIGKDSSAHLQQLAAAYPEHVDLTGYVEDLDARLSIASAMLVPLTFGSGLKLKVIEAMRSGLPIISTGIGMEGVQTNDSPGIIVTEVDGFCEQMLKILDPKENEIASNGNLLAFQAGYSNSVVDECYKHLFLGVTAQV